MNISESDAARVRSFVAQAQLVDSSDTPAPLDRPWVRVMPMAPIIDDPVLENGPYVEYKLLIEVGQADQLYADAFVDDPGLAFEDPKMLMANVAEVFASDIEAMENLLPLLDDPSILDRLAPGAVVARDRAHE